MKHNLTKGIPENMKTRSVDGVALSPDDRARMQRLYEEVTSRLTEMAEVVSRNLDLGGELYPMFSPLPANHPAPKLKSNKKGREGEAQKKKKKKKKPAVIITDLGDGIQLACDPDNPGNCGCYYQELGVCGPCGEF